jgi:hypothetical protein
MAKNKGGGRKGAVRGRFQLLNPKTGRFSIFSSESGSIVWTKKSRGKAKGVAIRVPKKFQ